MKRRRIEPRAVDVAKTTYSKVLRELWWPNVPDAYESERDVVEVAVKVALRAAA